MGAAASAPRANDCFLIDRVLLPPTDAGTASDPAARGIVVGLARGRDGRPAYAGVRLGALGELCAPIHELSTEPADEERGGAADGTALRFGAGLSLRLTRDAGGRAFVAVHRGDVAGVCHEVPADVRRLIKPIGMGDATAALDAFVREARRPSVVAAAAPAPAPAPVPAPALAAAAAVAPPPPTFMRSMMEGVAFGVGSGIAREAVHAVASAVFGGGSSGSTPAPPSPTSVTAPMDDASYESREGAEDDEEEA